MKLSSFVPKITISLVLSVFAAVGCGGGGGGSKSIPVTGVSIKSETSILVGATELLAPQVLPSNASNRNVTWKSSNESIASVDTGGLVTAKALGDATVTVTTAETGYTADCVVHVTSTAVPVTGITLNSSTLMVLIYQTGQLVATIQQTTATNQNVIWSVDDTDIATVDATGVITAVDEGIAIVTATTVDGGKKAQCTVTIKDGYEPGKITLLTDINKTGAGSNPNNYAVIGSTVYFSASDGVNGEELWKSDGTVSGTVLVKDIYSGSNGSYPDSLTAVGSTFYFRANDGVNGYELWKSDGTVSGTVMVKDIYSGSNVYCPQYLTAVGSMLYFTANDGVNGYELWKSDGTASGTVMVKDIVSGSNGSSPQYLTAVGSTFYFTANDGMEE